MPMPSTDQIRALDHYDALPPGCATFLVSDGTCGPHLGRGEFAVVDMSDQRPQHGELFLIRSKAPMMKETRRVRQLRAAMERTNLAGPDEESLCWWIRPMRMTRDGEINGIPVFQGLSEGPYHDEHIPARLIGRVIGYASTDLGALMP